MKKNIWFKEAVLARAIGTWGLSVILLLGFSVALRAQEVYRAADPDIKVLGTSNLHNWSMETKDVSCTAKFNFPSAGGAQPLSISVLDLSIPVHNLKSGESLMDSRAYSALKADKFAVITFTSTSAIIVPGQNNQFQVKSTGSMTIAGVAQPVVVTAACKVDPDGAIACNGSVQLKMTDYKIKPPVFMLGALRTGDLLNINFSLTLKK